MSRERVAYHEAGHAAAAIHFGLRVKEAWIDDETGATLIVYMRSTRRYVEPIVALAGPCAEGRLFGAEPTDEHQEAAGAWERSRAISHGTAAIHAERMLTHRVNQILDQQWPLVEAIAGELMTHARLVERELREIVRDHGKVYA